MVLDDRIKKGRFSELVCVHRDRSKFSSRCSKSQHGNCNGKVSKKRSEDGICPCECHDIKQVIELRFLRHGKDDFVLSV